ncbi:hypothetical protein J421_0041 [Gemmatirosa kalamazoonensis]|uniref:NrS-1 polymerase-like helicase domain-containing protein n=2 Tax=Gemmatirosa kalamazoonensis TaxID=861299 RepID=W0RDW7_9BACT|nr:hypothetical protein J421_0019 [Gemmatirosa kalamazoonensis]AHG87578.1 hypothetical protein J421_0041 [Gemmatirosa kalamazoonensis]
MNGRAGVRTIRPVDPLITEFNATHAVVLVGGEPAVLCEEAGRDGRPTVRLLSVRAFREWLRPRRADVDRWLASRDRREYPRGVVFEPDAEIAGAFNLWRGFAVEPDPAPHPEERCARFLEHLYENICQSDERLFEWVVGWLAQIVQSPRTKLGTSLFLRGKQGTGKTKVGEAMRRLLGRHYMLVSDPRYVVGRFNAHLESLLLLHADEAFFAGDPTAVGRLKDLVTGHEQVVERKGREPVVVSNYVRLLGTADSVWVVPANERERRFAVIDVGDAHERDFPYFAAIDRELDAGGASALLAYLLAYDLSALQLRQIPETPALIDQKVRSLAPEAAWWLDVLKRGELPASRFRDGRTCEVSRLVDDYIEHAQRRGTPRRASEVVLGGFLSKQVPGVERVRRTAPDGTRPWAYVFPSLAECRQTAPATFRGWNDPAADWKPADG